MYGKWTTETVLPRQLPAKFRMSVPHCWKLSKRFPRGSRCNPSGSLRSSHPRRKSWRETPALNPVERWRGKGNLFLIIVDILERQLHVFLGGHYMHTKRRQVEHRGGETADISFTPLSRTHTKMRTTRDSESILYSWYLFCFLIRRCLSDKIAEYFTRCHISRSENSFHLGDLILLRTDLS